MGLNVVSTSQPLLDSISASRHSINPLTPSRPLLPYGYISYAVWGQL